MTKIKILILLLLCISCSKKSEIESLFIANKNEYWGYKNYCNNNKGVYFQFRENWIYDKYIRTYNGFGLFNNDGDLLSGPRTWSIKNDSVFLLDKGSYKIEKITNREILLSYYHNRIKGKKCFVKLSKWILTRKGPKKTDSAELHYVPAK